MQVHFGLELLQPEWTECLACLGAFDGVHVGHREVLRHAVETANDKNIPSVLVTFDQNPAAILAPEKCPPYIASLRSNLCQFERAGVSVAVVLKFDLALSQTSAEDFFESILKKRIRANGFVVGHDFTFGKDRGGSAQWLAARSETTVVPPFLVDGERVSSSGIRGMISSGDIQAANRLLGRPFLIEGVVVAGQRLGRTLGFPTINIARSFNQVNLADGVYAGECETPLGSFKAAISIGARPTVDESRTIEAYLLDYPGETLYGQSVALSVSQRLRGQVKFDSLEQLKSQMASDVVLVSRV